MLLHIDIMLFEELLTAPVNESVVEVFTTQMGVTIDCQNLKRRVIDSNQRDIESSATKIEHQHINWFFTLLIHTKCKSSCSWLVNNTDDFKASDSTGLLRGLSLGIIEVGWYSDYTLLNLTLCEFFSLTLQVLKHNGGNHLRVELLCLTFELHLNHWLFLCTLNNLEWPEFDIFLHDGIIEFTSNQSFDVKDCVFMVPDNLIFGSGTNKADLLVEGDVGWGDFLTLLIWNNDNLTFFYATTARVGCSKVNTNSSAFS